MMILSLTITKPQIEETHLFVLDGAFKTAMRKKITKISEVQQNLRVIKTKILNGPTPF
jgi:hypothetical protein